MRYIFSFPHFSMQLYRRFRQVWGFCGVEVSTPLLDIVQNVILEPISFLDLILGFDSLTIIVQDIILERMSFFILFWIKLHRTSFITMISVHHFSLPHYIDIYIGYI